jgi:hypothetical protein
VNGTGPLAPFVARCSVCTGRRVWVGGAGARVRLCPLCDFTPPTPPSTHPTEP